MDSSGNSQTAQLRPCSRVVVAIGLVLGLLVALGGVAEAQNRQEQAQQVERVPPVPAVETLRLACSPDVIDGQRGVLCQWSEATNPLTRGYKLLRITDGSPRELVATVGAHGRLGYFDTEITAPSSLLYGVISVNRNGRLTGRSAPVNVQFGQDLEQLRMSCAPDSIGGQRGVLCRWSDSTEARGYLVYRITNGEPRELIASVPTGGRTGHFDTDVEAGTTLTYGVTAVNASGSVIGVGGPQHVSWPDVD